MNRKISFQNMEPSIPIKEHANEKLNKISELLKNAESIKPYTQTLFLTASKEHPHHKVELNLKTPHFYLNAHAEGTDMYVTIDTAVDKMIRLIKKEKDKWQDKTRKTETKKSDFSSDKYTLSED